MDDFTEELQAHNKQVLRISGRDAQLRSKEMQKQTLAALASTINKISNIEEYNVE